MHTFFHEFLTFWLENIDKTMDYYCFTQYIQRYSAKARDKKPCFLVLIDA